MSASLLDTNALIALLDPAHVFHPLVARWFRDNFNAGWATCPLTQNGFIRIVSHPSYPQHIGIGQAITVLRTALGNSAHCFWPDDITLADAVIFDESHLLGSGQVTDTYLLGLAARHGGRLVTLDRRIDTTTVRDASSSSLLILNPAKR